MVPFIAGNRQCCVPHPRPDKPPDPPGRRRASPPADVSPEAYTPNGIRDFLTGTQLELGKYVDPRTYLALRAAGTGLPGIALRQRTSKGFIYEATLEPRFAISQPSLSPVNNTHPFEVFGAFITREWRF